MASANRKIAAQPQRLIPTPRALKFIGSPLISQARKKGYRAGSNGF
jgi:hypothetical protein